MIGRRSFAVAAIAVSAALAAPATAAPVTGPVSVTVAPAGSGRMTAIGHPPDFQIGCSTSLFVAQLVIDTTTRAAIGISQGECGVQTTVLPAGSCRSNLPSRPGFSCSNIAADGTRRYASTSSSEPSRSFSFSEIRGDVWFQVDGVGTGAG